MQNCPVSSQAGSTVGWSQTHNLEWGKYGDLGKKKGGEKGHWWDANQKFFFHGQRIKVCFLGQRESSHQLCAIRAYFSLDSLRKRSVHTDRCSQNIYRTRALDSVIQSSHPEYRGHDIIHPQHLPTQSFLGNNALRAWYSYFFSLI